MTPFRLMATSMEPTIKHSLTLRDNYNNYKKNATKKWKKNLKTVSLQFAHSKTETETSGRKNIIQTNKIAYR